MRIKAKSGEGYVDVVAIVLAVMLVLALIVNVVPVFVAKQQLDLFASELCREAELAGRIGSETTRKAADLKDKTGLNPNISWSKTGTLQLQEKFDVTLTCTTYIGAFAAFDLFPITLRAKASGGGERYWK